MPKRTSERRYILPLSTLTREMLRILMELSPQKEWEGIGELKEGDFIFRTRFAEVVIPNYPAWVTKRLNAVYKKHFLSVAKKMLVQDQSKDLFSLEITSDKYSQCRIKLLAWPKDLNVAA